MDSLCFSGVVFCLFASWCLLLVWWWWWFFVSIVVCLFVSPAFKLRYFQCKNKSASSNSTKMASHMLWEGLRCWEFYFQKNNRKSLAASFVCHPCLNFKCILYENTNYCLYWKVCVLFKMTCKLDSIFPSKGNRKYQGTLDSVNL